MQHSHALVRVPSPRFSDALSESGAVPDAEQAAEQHRRYTANLSAAGLTVIALPPDRELPDSCFVEDRAVVVGSTALITRSAAPSRSAEAQAVMKALAPYLRCAHMAAQATLDGGDVLRLGDRLFVGLSARTNRAGVEALRLLAEPEGIEVVAVEVRGALHLKSIAAPLGNHTVLVLDGTLDPGLFGAARTLCVPDDEPRGANALALADRVLMSAAAPRTAELVRQAGMNVVTIDVSEFEKADGALTCLSIPFGHRRAGTHTGPGEL